MSVDVRDRPLRRSVAAEPSLRAHELRRVPGRSATIRPGRGLLSSRGGH
jgi:hypothetical protein